MFRLKAFVSFLFFAPLALADTPPLIDVHMHVWAMDTIKFPFAHPFDSNYQPPRLAATARSSRT